MLDRYEVIHVVCNGCCRGCNPRLSRAVARLGAPPSLGPAPHPARTNPAGHFRCSPSASSRRVPSSCRGYRSSPTTPSKPSKGPSRSWHRGMYECLRHTGRLVLTFRCPPRSCCACTTARLPDAPGAGGQTRGFLALPPRPVHLAKLPTAVGCRTAWPVRREEGGSLPPAERAAAHGGHGLPHSHGPAVYGDLRYHQAAVRRPRGESGFRPHPCCLADDAGSCSSPATRPTNSLSCGRCRRRFYWVSSLRRAKLLFLRKRAFASGPCSRS